MPQNATQLRHARRCARQRANRKLFKGEEPKIPSRSNFPTVEELLVWHMNPKYWYRDEYGIWKRRGNYDIQSGP